MKKILLFVFAIAVASSCQCAKHASLPKSLDEVDYFYFERTSNYAYVHTDPLCGKHSVYLNKSEVWRNRDYLCSKCVSKELAKEIMALGNNPGETKKQ